MIKQKAYFEQLPAELNKSILRPDRQWPFQHFISIFPHPNHMIFDFIYRMAILLVPFHTLTFLVKVFPVR
ncbi:hypothetical protein X809_39470 [Paenibacillus polymyxa CR1]|nr:hypothetical protein X809_39470 [Paenibacillus polymyxa CR1]